MVFINSKEENPSEVLVSCVEAMQYVYKLLLQTFCIGNKYLEMQQSWFMYLQLYLDDEKAIHAKVEGINEEDKHNLQMVSKDIIQKGKEYDITLQADC
jgi:hypothetical protein